jgi:predicted phage terminase large subunit-like protein
MRLQRIQKYVDFANRTKNEPVVIYQGSKRSGKTHDILIGRGLEFFSNNSSGLKIQCFSESPKQQNFGLMSDFQKLFNPVLNSVKTNATQKTYRYKSNELAFINIADNVKANDIANSLGACDIRYVNECNNFSKDTIEKLMINNRGQMFFDFNPYREFWIQELITENNFLKTTWKDNPFLTKVQMDLFLKWTDEGQRSEIGSYPYWRWQVLCEGNFAELTGEIFTPENIHFAKEKPDGLHNYLIMADPSNAKGNDYFALTLTAVSRDGFCYLIDSFSCNRIEKVLIAEKIRQWQKDFQVQRTFVETNGEFGLKFYNDCMLAGIQVEGWYSRKDKFERIMANFDVITNKLMVLDTPQNREFIQQVYTFKLDCANDDNIDCLNNAIMAYILVYGQLKILF